MKKNKKKLFILNLIINIFSTFHIYKIYFQFKYVNIIGQFLIIL